MELKFDTGFRVVGEYLSQSDLILRVKLTIWLSILSQFDSNTLQLLGILGRILVPPVTQLTRSKWLHFFLPVFRAPESRLCSLAEFPSAVWRGKSSRLSMSLKSWNRRINDRPSNWRADASEILETAQKIWAGNVSSSNFERKYFCCLLLSFLLSNIAMDKRLRRKIWKANIGQDLFNSQNLWRVRNLFNRIV